MRAFWDNAGRLPSTPAHTQGQHAPPRAGTVVLDKAAHEALSALAEGTDVTLATELKPAQVSHTWNAIGKLAGRDKRPRR